MLKVLSGSENGRREGFAHQLVLTRLLCDELTDAQEL